MFTDALSNEPCLVRKKNLTNQASLPEDLSLLVDHYEELRPQFDQPKGSLEGYLIFLRMGFLSWGRSMHCHDPIPIAPPSTELPSEFLSILVNMIASTLQPLKP